MQHRVSDQLESRFDSNSYDESQLVELKVPINLPYQTNWSSYQRFDGEIEIAGTLYKYVKRKVTNDTLYLMCLPNTKKMHLETAKNDFFKVTNDLSQNDNSKKSDNSKSLTFKNLQGEYDEYSFHVNSQIPLASTGNFIQSGDSDNLVSCPHISPEQPPDALKA